MHDFLSNEFEARWRGEADDVNRLAARVVSVLATKGQGGGSIREPLLTTLLEAATSGSHARLEAAVDELRRTRVPTRLIADLYIPEAARRLGEGWMQDSRSFVDVTLGCAMLQSLLRTLGAEWAADRSEEPDRGSFLVAVPEGADHTLGALVATGWLRRNGVSVCQRIGAPADALCDLAATARFDAILLSWGDAEKLDVLGKLVKKLRTSLKQAVPILVGGPVIGRANGVERATGADLATNDLDYAMRWLAERVASQPAMNSLTHLQGAT